MKDDLIIMEDIEFKTWDYTMPTIQTDDPFPEYEVKHLNASTVKENLFNALPFLRALNWDNILLAGGVMTAFVTPSTKPVDGNQFGDLDFFIYGLTVKNSFYET